MQNHENRHQADDAPLISASLREGGSPTPSLNLKMKLQLNHAKNARASLARVIRRYAAGEIDHTQYKGLVYGFSALLAYYRHETDQEILKRIEILEQQLESGKC